MSFDEVGRPKPVDEVVRRRMARQLRRDTDPELRLRRALHALGYRYRVDAPLPGLPRRRADLLFSRRRVVIFVDGCFWHGCPEHRSFPRHNADWWLAKIETNVARDRDTDSRLQRHGWRVIRVWEHEEVEKAVRRVVAELGADSVTG